MPTIEKRVQALEEENATRKKEIAARKQAEELLTITVRALVSKEAFEKLQETVENIQETVEKSQEQYGKLFDVINTHNVFTNERLGDIQNQIIEVDGKIVGQQAEMRQGFKDTQTQVTELDGKSVGVQAEMRQHLAEQDAIITGLDT